MCHKIIELVVIILLILIGIKAQNDSTLLKTANSSLTTSNTSNDILLSHDLSGNSEGKSAIIINNYNLFSYYHFQKGERFSILKYHKRKKRV